MGGTMASPRRQDFRAISSPIVHSRWPEDGVSFRRVRPPTAIRSSLKSLSLRGPLDHPHFCSPPSRTKAATTPGSPFPTRLLTHLAQARAPVLAKYLTSAIRLVVVVHLPLRLPYRFQQGGSSLSPFQVSMSPKESPPRPGSRVT